MNQSLSSAQKTHVAISDRFLAFVRINDKRAFFFLLSFTTSLFVLSCYLTAFILNPVSAIRSEISASYLVDGSEINAQVDIVELDPGRFRLAITDLNGPLYLKLKLPEESKKNYLMLRRGFDPFGRKTVDKFSL